MKGHGGDASKQTPKQPKNLQYKIEQHLITPQSQNPSSHIQIRQKDQLLKQIIKFRQIQAKEKKCYRKLSIIDKLIDHYDSSFYQQNKFQTIQQCFKIYYKKYIEKLIIIHQQKCYKCNELWFIEQWQKEHHINDIKDIKDIKINKQRDYQIFSFKISQNTNGEELDVFIYKYISHGDAYLKKDKVRNMKIFKKPLAQNQLTNLIFHHQYLVVECQHSYWSFEKDTKRLIIQSSKLLSDVRDRILGQHRIKQMGFKWFGLRSKWQPEVMYQSNNLRIDDISQVRQSAQKKEESSLKYNVFKANCKVYAQTIMKSCLRLDEWGRIQTFFDFFNK